MEIARNGVLRLLMIVVVGVMLAACAGADLGTPAGPSDETTRLKLTDQCMNELGRSAGLKDKIHPRCQCYARGMMAGAGASDAVMAACAKSATAFAATPARKKPATTPAPAAPAKPQGN